MKKVLMIISFGFIRISAMECPEPTHKKQKPTEETLGGKPMEMSEEDVITLVSAQGDEFEVPVHVARRASQIDGLFEVGAIQNNKIEFKLISTNTLKLMLPLLTRLDQLLAQNEMADALNQIYIPRRYQSEVNERLRSVSNQDIADLYQAADVLELPFLINAIAAVIANRVRVPSLEYKNHNEQLEVISQVAADMNIQVGQEYILKHVLMRQSGFTEEYSIADYIADKGQPKLDENQNIKFNNVGLTSLFGIERIQSRNQVAILSISDNFLYDVSLDVQPTQNPFREFVLLESLSLRKNRLNKLPENFFADLHRLQTLILSDNPLSTLPETILRPLTQLHYIRLAGCALTELPERIFAGLVLLHIIELESNRLKTLPEGIFAGLVQLEHIYLYFNQLETLPERIFAGLVQLQEIALWDNQLKSLPQRIFAGLDQLRELQLENNNLEKLPILAGLNLEKLFLGGNKLSRREEKRIRKELPNRDIRFKVEGYD